MKKQRGLKRYYRNLSTQNDLHATTWLDFADANIWFDNWHLHFDWNGYGNNSFKSRKPHLDKLFRHFDLLVMETKKLNQGFQLYAMIYDFDSYNDALFVHTAVPASGCPFPFTLPGLSAQNNLSNTQLSTYLNELSGYEKLYGFRGQLYCLLFKSGIGVPFWIE